MNGKERVLKLKYSRSLRILISLYHPRFTGYHGAYRLSSALLEIALF